jgi:cold shock protein
MKGTIIWYDIRKGYGFIRGTDGTEAFVHKGEVPFWTIFFHKGDKVEYLLEQSNRGNIATNIKMI